MRPSRGSHVFVVAAAGIEPGLAVNSAGLGWRASAPLPTLASICDTLSCESEAKGGPRGDHNMPTLGRGAVALSIVAMLSWGAPARAQDLDRNKSATKLFASNCASCHRSARGLAKGRISWTLSNYLQQHYTSSPESAQALTAYLQSVDTPPAKPRPAKAASARSQPQTTRASTTRAAATRASVADPSAPRPPAPVPRR